MVQLFFIAHGIVLCLKMISFLFQLNQLLAALIQCLDCLTNVIGAKFIDGAAIIHCTAIGLRVNLQNGTAKSRFTAARFAYQSKGFALIDLEVDAVIGFDIHTALFQREPLLQIADAEQNFFII